MINLPISHVWLSPVIMRQDEPTDGYSHINMILDR